MADTLDQLIAHLDRHGGTARVVVWAHNSQVGDARATEMAGRGELNIGQLMRERDGRDAVNVGFTTRTGTVTAASEWGGAAERKRVRASLPDSYEALFHATRLPAFLLCPLPAGDSGRALRDPRLHRAIGVVYRQRPSARATGSPPASPCNTTRSSTSTRPAPSSHSSGRPPGSSRNHPRPIPPRSEPHGPAGRGG